MLRVHSAQQLPLVEAQRDGVVGLAAPRFPLRLLAGEDDRQAVQVRDNGLVHRLAEGEEARLVGQELPDGDHLLALLGELRPVRAHALVVIEPAARVSQCERHRRKPLGGRVGEDHRVLFPRLAGGLVADPTP